MGLTYLKTKLETAASGSMVFYVEFLDGEPRRQVTHRSGHWAHSRPDLGRPDPELTDQPLTDEHLARSDEIDSSEFEEVWQRAINNP